MNVLLLLAHSIEEYDQIKLFSKLGVNVFSLGGYIDPRHPHDDKRPALPDAPFFPDLKAVVDGLGTPDNLAAAKRHIPDDIIDWADTIIVHHYPDVLWLPDENRSVPGWIAGNWDRIKHKRVIWRTVGQSVDGNESRMAQFRRDGLEIIRYSPKEANIPNYCGSDALIRFAKDPADWYGWTGERAVVGNVTQDLPGRHPYTNAEFWLDATRGLPSVPAGPGSEKLGGMGALTYEGMREYLRSIRAYLYTGTQPASYTLGLIEAMMTGVPVVSIGPSHMRIFPYGHLMFEGHELVETWIELFGGDYDPNQPDFARMLLAHLLRDGGEAQRLGEAQRSKAIDLFGIDTIADQWAAFLDVKVYA